MNYNTISYNAKNTHMGIFSLRGIKCYATFNGMRFFNTCRTNGNKGATAKGNYKVVRKRDWWAKFRASHFFRFLRKIYIGKLIDGVVSTFFNVWSKCLTYVKGFGGKEIVVESFIYSPKYHGVFEEWLEGWGWLLNPVNDEDMQEMAAADTPDVNENERFKVERNADIHGFDPSKASGKAMNWFNVQEFYMQCIIVFVGVLILILSFVACYCCCCAGPDYPYPPPYGAAAPYGAAPPYDVENPRRTSMVPPRQWPPTRSSQSGYGGSRRSSRRGSRRR